MADRTEERTDRGSEKGDGPRRRRRRREDDSNGRGGRRRRDGARAVVERAKRELGELMGREPESVSSFERDDDGWRVTLEFLELERIPNTSDVLASYEATLDEDGELIEYRRVRRYVRSQSDGG